MTLDEWIELGVAQGWIGPPVCDTHDGTPYSEAELDSFEAGDEPCVWIMRLYRDETMRLAVEAAHSPSVWRK